jgi:hypothetical protein
MSLIPSCFIMGDAGMRIAYIAPGLASSVS